MLVFGTFFVYDQINDQYFSYLLGTLRKEVSIKLFLIVFHHIVLFRFKAKYRGGGRSLKFNLGSKTALVYLEPVESFATGQVG